MTRDEKLKFIQRRWKEVVADLAVQQGMNPDSLFQKIPVFSADVHELDQESLRFSPRIEFKNMTKEEIRVLKSAADIMADVIVSILPEPNPAK